MTRVDQSRFTLASALYRGTEAGVARITRESAPGPSWARVTDPGAGLSSEYLYLEQHSGMTIVYSVDGAADAAPPHTAHRDARLTAVGQFFELEDPYAAERANEALVHKLNRDNAAIHADTFSLSGREGTAQWRVEVSPTAFGRTSLVLRDPSGTTRVLTTTEPRSTLETARTSETIVTATEMINRRLGAGRKERSVSLTLGPAEATP